jgi:ribosomal subunit interface protein
MNTNNITARHFELTDAITNYAQNKLASLPQEILEVHLILEVEKNPKIFENQLAELNLKIPGDLINVKASSKDLYASIDEVVDKAIKLLHKNKDKAVSN